MEGVVEESISVFYTSSHGYFTGLIPIVGASHFSRSLCYSPHPAPAASPVVRPWRDPTAGHLMLQPCLGDCTGMPWCPADIDDQAYRIPCLQMKSILAWLLFLFTDLSLVSGLRSCPILWIGHLVSVVLRLLSTTCLLSLRIRIEKRELHFLIDIISGYFGLQNRARFLR